MSYYKTVGDGLKAILMGDTSWLKNLPKLKKPPVIAIPNNDEFVGDEMLDSYKMAIIMRDSLLDDLPEYYEKFHTEEMCTLHQKLFPHYEGVDYSKSDCVCYNDLPMYEENDDCTKALLRDGVRQIDIVLSNAICMHREPEVIKLLKSGASPYFIDYEDCFGTLDYENCAPALGKLDVDIDFYWTEVPKKFPNHIDDMTEDELCDTFFALYNIAGHSHILRVVDKYILPEVKAKGEELLEKYCGKDI